MPPMLNRCFNIVSICDSRRLDGDALRPTNINENFDVALEELWPYVIRNGRDRLDLPDIVEGFQYVIWHIEYESYICVDWLCPSGFACAHANVQMNVPSILLVPGV